MAGFNEVSPWAQMTQQQLLDQQMAQNVAPYVQAPQAPQQLPQPSAPVMPFIQPQKTAKAPSPTAVTSRSDYDDLVKRLNEKGLDSLKGQAQGVQDQTEMLNLALGQRNGLDLSPLMALTDSWTGSNLQKGYSKPDPTALQGSLQTMQQALQKSKNDLSQNDIDLLKGQLGIESHRLDMQDREKDRQVQRSAIAAQKEVDAGLKAQKLSSDQLVKASNDLGHDDAFKEALKKQDEIDSFKSQVAQAQVNPLANNTLPMALVRQYVNRVSQPELTSAGGSKALLDRAEQAGKEMSSGTLTETNAKWMNDLNASMDKQNKQAIKGHIERHANVFSKVSGMPADDAADTISGGLYSKVLPPKLTDDDKAAIDWAKANPTDSRSAQILSLHGGG